MTIVSTKKYVFIKVFKTGGTSILNGMLSNDSSARRIQRIRDGQITFHIESSWMKENTFPELGLNWDEYFKFGFVRNPWDRELSSYFFNNETLKPPKNISFKRWLKYTLREDAQRKVSKSPQFEYLTDVDYVARFENYTEEVKYIFNKLKLPLPNKLHHIHKTEHKPYWEYYDDADIMKVHQWYEKDIEMYDYEFGQ